MDRKDRQPTRVGRDVAGREPMGSAPRRTQMYDDAPKPRQSPHTSGDNRRIVGVLVSYTWEPSGRLFEVREGRTHIGSGEVSDTDGPMDVQCAQDSMLSEDHAMILVRQGSFYIRDLSSTNGTVLNGKPLRPEAVEDLPSPSEIKAGETTFTFVRVDTAPAAVVGGPGEEVPKGGRPPTVLK